MTKWLKQLRVAKYPINIIFKGRHRRLIADLPVKEIISETDNTSHSGTTGFHFNNMITLEAGNFLIAVGIAANMNSRMDMNLLLNGSVQRKMAMFTAI